MFAKDITVKAEINDISPILVNHKNTLPYEVPADYFEVFSSRMSALIRSIDIEDELMALSPVLSQISRKLPYQASSSGMTDKMTADIIGRKEQAGVISIFSSKVVRYAVAASVLIASLTFVIKNILPTKNNELVNIPAAVSEQQFNQLLASADEKEIIQYLQEEGLQLNQAEIETMVEPSLLPDEIDYFDEQFSDEFFEEIQSDLNKTTL